MASKIHLLKCWPEFFKAVKSGEKTFEIRMNDREYQVGDVLIMSEYDPSTSTYTGEHVSRRVTYLTSAYQVEGYVVMSLIPDEGGYDVVMIEHYQALRDEVARLRGALQDIHDSIGNGALNVEWIKRFAQAALTQGKGGGE